MKNPCSTCTHRAEIVNSHRVSCQYFLKNKSNMLESPLHKGDVPEYAKTSGWFDFPYDFDPLWVSLNCIGYKHRIEEEILYSDAF